MARIHFKPGIQAGQLHVSIHHALNIAGLIWKQNFPGVDCVVTSLRDGAHSTESFHYGTPDSGDIDCRAMDLRTRTLSRPQYRTAVHALRLMLGDAYDVVDETNHIHVEYDPY